MTDGIALIHLCEVLTGKTVSKYEKTPKSDFHKVSNLNLALDKFKEDGIKVFPKWHFL